jgi:23S rRNA (uracil1939-C5)-methyltransferase
MAASTADVRIRGIASGGSGVGDLPDGRVVFVPRTSPGDEVRVRIEKSKARWAVGSLQRILDPAPDRVEAPCALYAECGGCQIQHLSYEQQLSAKAGFVSDALVRIGGFEGLAPIQVIGSPREIHYRNRVTYTLRRLRGGHVIAGFHALGRPAHVLDVLDQCLLPVEELVPVWSRIRAGWGEGARNLPDGGRIQLTLRTVAAGVELLVHGGAAAWNAVKLAAEVPELTAIWHVPAGPRALAVLVSGHSAPGGGASFEQVNADVAALLRDYVIDQAGSGISDAQVTGRGAIDAYCGIGEYGHALAQADWSVTGIEVDPAAVEAARSKAVKGFELRTGLVEECLEELLPAELLIVNPPRTGLAKEVPPVIAAEAPLRLIYVSCDPATLARDLGALSDVFELQEVRAFDLFPQTAHVETVAVLTKREAGG